MMLLLCYKRFIDGKGALAFCFFVFLQGTDLGPLFSDVFLGGVHIHLEGQDGRDRFVDFDVSALPEDTSVASIVAHNL